MLLGRDALADARNDAFWQMMQITPDGIFGLSWCVEQSELESHMQDLGWHLDDNPPGLVKGRTTATEEYGYYSFACLTFGGVFTGVTIIPSYSWPLIYQFLKKRFGRSERVEHPATRRTGWQWVWGRTRILLGLRGEDRLPILTVEYTEMLSAAKEGLEKGWDREGETSDPDQREFPLGAEKD